MQVSANTQCVASYHTNSGHYSIDAHFFSASEYGNAPLTALRSGVNGGNGVYLYGSGGFPTETWGGESKYWVDVFFVTGFLRLA